METAERKEMDLIFYFCDRKKCEHCFEKCLHTADPEHALSKTEWPYTKDPWGNFVQVFTGAYDHETVEALNATTDNRPGENV